jgi:hypothetical protein
MANVSNLVFLISLKPALHSIQFTTQRRDRRCWRSIASSSAFLLTMWPSVACSTLAMRREIDFHWISLQVHSERKMPSIDYEKEAYGRRRHKRSRNNNSTRTIPMTMYEMTRTTKKATRKWIPMRNDSRAYSLSLSLAQWKWMREMSRLIFH